MAHLFIRKVSITSQFKKLKGKQSCYEKHDLLGVINNFNIKLPLIVHSFTVKELWNDLFSSIIKPLPSS